MEINNESNNRIPHSKGVDFKKVTRSTNFDVTILKNDVYHAYVDAKELI
ncbi:hypothetical protein [Desulfobacula sp.]|nr:hypothetical protein [Desulfobacula sp.]